MATLLKVLNPHKKRGHRFIAQGLQSVQHWLAGPGQFKELQQKLTALKDGGAADQQMLRQNVETLDKCVVTLPEELLECAEGEALWEAVMFETDKASTSLTHQAMDGIVEANKFDAVNLKSCHAFIKDMHVFQKEPTRFDEHVNALEYCLRLAQNKSVGHFNNSTDKSEMEDITNEELFDACVSNTQDQFRACQSMPRSASFSKYRSGPKRCRP